MTDLIDFPVPDAPRGNDRNSGYERKSLDWYCENEAPVEALLDHEDFSGHLIYDPSCGRGNILDVCAARGLDTVGSDVVDRGASERHTWFHRDFLSEELLTLPERTDAWLSVYRGGGGKIAIINNPPYGRLEKNMPRGDTYAERFIRRALSLHGADKAAFIVQGKFLWSGRRWRLFEVDHPPTQLIFCSERPSMPPGEELPRLIAEGKAFEGGAMDYLWLLYVRGEAPRPPAWLKPRKAKAPTETMP